MENSKEITKEDIVEVRKEIESAKENLLIVNKDMKEIKVIVSDILEKLTLKNTKKNILIAGGVQPLGAIKTTEEYSWEENCWYERSSASMNEEHVGASSFVFDDQLYVIGGQNTREIEILDLKNQPFKWKKFENELPYKFGEHQTVVSKQRIIHIGGYNHDERERCQMISELHLTSPCKITELCNMLEPRDCHGSEVFEDKVIILGGQKSVNFSDALESVLEFDLKTGECRLMEPGLTEPLTQMATVCWRDKVVLLGGRNKEEQVLNDVFMYNWKTGENTTLPSMLEKRCECSAVITENTIVVMGGKNEEDDILNSVECFTIGGHTWKRLPSMNKHRHKAIAEVLP